METNKRQVKKRKVKTNKIEVKHLVVALIVMVFIGMFQTCGVNSKTKRNTAKLEVMTKQINTIDSVINADMVSQDAFLLHVEMLRFKLANDILYDQNAIVRTVFRPDDRMRYYQLQLDSIRNDLMELNNKE